MMKTAALLGLQWYMREISSKFMKICEPSDLEEDVIKGVVIGILVVVENVMEPLPALYKDVALTAECPLCKKTFDSDVIEIHAANCGLRTAEYDDNFSDPINTLQSSGEILNWIASKVDQTNTFSICISRNDIYNKGMQQWKRQKKSTPKDSLKVTFFGEAGVDSGALSKEFLTGYRRMQFMPRPDGRAENGKR
ncbi:hypothetical protein E1301_Tti019190 [Triplophysa tibetana]|uniref:HECT domain-containing protein n=1 Tax=Triplophysa tibetana TaxID=1572043 RepID=A0A5A9P3Q9_9TELE|nr:hypothetical protein E1301_Tti019190 [Triplophysa tibetana]